MPVTPGNANTTSIPGNKPGPYDPVKFIREHIQGILPAGSEVRNIEFPGFIRKAFHSADRPSGYITVTYATQDAEFTLKLFVKIHQGAQKVFDQMSVIYNGLSAYNLQMHMPRPVICDTLNNVSYMEYIEGSALSYKVLRSLIFRESQQLVPLFRNIGLWLKHYHDTTRLENSMTLDQVKHNVLTGLETTPFFSAPEKQILANRVKSLQPENTFLVMVKPHNDFAMRNIIINAGGNFTVIDWDAMFHRKFRSESPIWSDIATYLISVSSLRRFSPLISSADLKILCNAFLNGYFEGNGAPPDSNEINDMLYLYTLKFYLGTIGDRPLKEIYKEKLGSRYIRKLRADLLKGNCI